MLKKLVWPGLPIIILGGGVILNILMVSLAVRDGGYQYEPNYYQKAIKWDETIAQEKRNAALGWKLTFVNVPVVSSSNAQPFCISLKDKKGAVLDQTSVKAVAFHNAHSMQRKTLLFQRKGALHCVTYPFKRGGLWEFRFTAKRINTIFTNTTRHALKQK